MCRCNGLYRIGVCWRDHFLQWLKENSAPECNIGKKTKPNKTPCSLITWFILSPFIFFCGKSDFYFKKTLCDYLYLGFIFIRCLSGIVFLRAGGVGSGKLLGCPSACRGREPSLASLLGLAWDPAEIWHTIAPCVGGGQQN